jgi:hypothetical protein
MSIRLLDERQEGLNRSQLINSAVIVLTALGLLLMGLMMRNSALSASQPFLDEESGIRALIPAGWLITRDDPEFVVQAQDPGAVPFKTVLRVALMPVGEGATSSNIVDQIILDRSARLTAYRTGAIEEILLDDQPAIQMEYAFVETEPNPFLNTVPVVVQGRDVVIVRGQQALVVTYLEERSRFEENEFLFDNFLARLEY